MERPAAEVALADERRLQPSAVIDAALARAGLPERATLAGLAETIGPFAVVDLETTGLDPSRARVIEIGAVIVHPGRAAELFHRLVDPREPLPPFTRRLTGLCDADLAGQATWDRASRELAEAISGDAVVAHNAAFERAFLAGLLPTSTAYLDSLELACVLRPELAGHSLDALTRLLLGRRERHRALDDALDTLAVLARLHEEVEAGEHRVLAARPAGLAGEVRWSWHAWLEAADRRSRQGAAMVARALDRSTALPLEEPARAAAATRSRARIPREWLEPGFVRALLADEERWRRVLPGYRARDGQIELTCAMLEAFRSERAFASEAGTGIGKTLAYGLVSLLHCLHHDERVVISSANRTLQERVVRDELPRIARVLGLDAAPGLILKGRGNFANPERMRTVAADPAALGFPLSPAARSYLTSFLARCADRDLQGFGGWLGSQEPILWSLRERIACSSDCAEERCRAEQGGPCAYLQRVDALREAGVVSINHALLLTWPARYGPIDRLVIDEAHELAAEADRSFSEELRARDLRAWLRQLLGSAVRGGLLAALARHSGDDQLARDALARSRALLDQVETVGRALFLATGAEEVVVPPASAIGGESAWSGALEETARLALGAVELGQTLERLAAATRRRGGEDGSRDALAGESAALGAMLGVAGRGLLAEAFGQTRPDTVYAARCQRRLDEHDWWLRATPLDTAPLLHARLLEPARTVIAVSATLGVGGDPSPSLQKLGWEELAPERRMRSLVVPSPFDFPERAVLALVRGGGYRRRGFADRCAAAIADVARRLDGRTLALFTSRQRLMEVAARLGPLLADDGIAVIAHERAGGAARLVEQFAADPRAVLLGTRSLWQGVDVPGDALSCVVIDKLPFPRPEDPLVRGRSERLRAAGGDPFRSLALEPAVVAFKQMFGRLIRSESDRGFVVVLGADVERSYMPDFVGSLPGPPRLLVAEWPQVRAEIERFFASPEGREGARDVAPEEPA